MRLLNDLHPYFDIGVPYANSFDPGCCPEDDNSDPVKFEIENCDGTTETRPLEDGETIIPGVVNVRICEDATPKIDVELTCVEENDNLYLVVVDKEAVTTTVFDLAGADVTGTVTPKRCPNDDFELVKTDFCIDGVGYTRTDVVDVTEDPAQVLSSFWQDVSGAIVADPSAGATEILKGFCQEPPQFMPEIEPVCVDLGDGCNAPAFRRIDIDADGLEVVSFFDQSGDITATVTDWKAGICEPEKAFVDTCFLPDQYAIVWAWNGAGDIMSYDPVTQTWTDYGKTTLPDGTVVGGFSMDFDNDATNPRIVYQRSGCVYTAPVDNPTSLTLVGCSTNPSFASSYPCGAYDPSGRFLIGIGSGSTVGEVDMTTGDVATIGVLTDWRDGAPLSAGPGDWFFDPAGNWFLMASDTRGASFTDPITGNPYSTGTVLWQIDPATLVTTRVGNTPSPASGTGAAWISAGQYLLSTGSTIYTYQSNNDPVDSTPSAWLQNIPNAPHSINDLGNQWVVPDPIPIFGYVEKGCPDPADCESCLFTLEQAPDLTMQCKPFEITLPGKFKCETEPNPFITDPFSDSGSTSGCDRCPDEVWHQGCSDAGYTRWRVAYDAAGNAVNEYIYGTLTSPVSAPPPNFNRIPCGEVQPGTENVTIFCDLDSNTTVYRKEQTLTDGTIDVEWFDETGVILEPTNLAPDSCDTNDPLLPVTEEVICFEGEQYVRIEKEVNTINADGLPELQSYQILYFNADGILWDSGIVPATDPLPPGEPQGWYFGQCVNPYVSVENEKLCEIDARYLLLIDSGGSFARYSFYTKSWENVSTLSVSSAGGSADVENFLLYNFVAPDQMTVIDVNTDTQLPNVTLIDGVINPAVATNPKTFSAAAFRNADGKLYAWDTAGADAGLYAVDVNTGAVDFVTTISGVSGTGTSIAIDNTTDTLYISGFNLVYEVDFGTGVATPFADPPIRPNGATFDTDGNLYVTEGNDTYYLPAGADGNNADNWIQIIDDWTPGANSIAYYEVVAPSPSCFFRRFGVLEDGSREIIGDFNIADDSLRTVVGDVDCCECSCGDGSGSGSSDTAPTADFSTGFNTEVLASAFTVPTFPANTKEVVVMNLSGAYVQIDTNKGPQTVPPFGTIEFSVDDPEAAISATAISLVGGVFGPGENIVLNYKTRT